MVFRSPYSKEGDNYVYDFEVPFFEFSDVMYEEDQLLGPIFKEMNED